MKRTVSILLAGLLIPALLSAAPPGKPDIVVMTQNQYLGADLTPIITAGDAQEYNLAVLEALATVAGNNTPERVEALAGSILERKPHLVGLQEMFLFECIESASPFADCSIFSAAMNDHLELTTDALGEDYYVAAIVNNLDIPGLPVFLNDDPFPDVFIRVLDRDVIIARYDVLAEPVAFPCEIPVFFPGPTPSEDGCNYHTIAVATLPDGSPLPIQRGFVAVDATVGGHDYRLVNTHLEVQYPAPDQDAPLFQAAQATELLATMMMVPPPPGTRLMIVGDINSDPLHPVFMTSFGFPAYPPYQQLSMGVDLMGDPISFPYTDIWPMRPGKPPGYTCCQASDLSNDSSMHDERIDVIFTLQPPGRVKANVLGNSPEDKTPSGLWPSDHSSMVGRLFY